MKREHLIGVFITVSIHLAVILVLLLTVVTPNLKKQMNVFEIDFTKQDEIEKLEKEVARQKALNDRINKMLNEAGVPEEKARNISVDRSKLKDDRGTDAEKLYKENERIQRQYKEIMSNKGEEFIAMPEKKKEAEPQKEEEVYRGPSVLSYNLDGRKAARLPIPAYKCMGAGEVTVIITVDAAGEVVDAKIQEDVSSSDRCLCDYAIKAAKRSRFSAANNPKQIGNIVYSFISQ